MVSGLLGPALCAIALAYLAASAPVNEDNVVPEAPGMWGTPLMSKAEEKNIFTHHHAHIVRTGETLDGLKFCDLPYASTKGCQLPAGCKQNKFGGCTGSCQGVSSPPQGPPCCLNKVEEEFNKDYHRANCNGPGHPETNVEAYVPAVKISTSLFKHDSCKGDAIQVVHEAVTGICYAQGKPIQHHFKILHSIVADGQDKFTLMNFDAKDTFCTGKLSQMYTGTNGECVEPCNPSATPMRMLFSDKPAPFSSTPDNTYVCHPGSPFCVTNGQAATFKEAPKSPNPLPLPVQKTFLKKQSESQAIHNEASRNATDTSGSSMVAYPSVLLALIVAMLGQIWQ